MSIKTNIRLVLVALFAVFAMAVQAQTSVSGNVKDGTGEGVIGATVMEKGNAKNATVTDLNGNFTLKLQGKEIVISYIGMKTKTVNVAGKKSVNVVLEDDNTTLNDVVVIGYGTMRRKDLTGSVASVSGDKIAANPVSNVAEALQGQLPGVNVISQDGRPGATQSIRVRGGGSITQSNDPLYIVDGIQVSSIDDIPADNVESIDVLKDAASTAIYGARGANGVILITTKGGKEGKPTVRYSAYYQIKAEPQKLDVMDAYDNILWNWSYATAYGKSYGDGVARYYGLGSANGNNLEKYKGVEAHNYMDDVLRTGHMQNHDVSISGGTEKTKYFANVSYMNDKASLINSGFRRWSANFKLQQKITKNLNLDINARYAEMQFKGSQFAYATQAYRYKPVDKVYGSDDPADLGMGSQSAEPSYNPVDIINDYEDLRKRYRLHVNTGLTWNILKGLTAKTELYLGRHWSETQNWNGGHTQGQGYNTAKLNKQDGYNTRWDTTLSYDVQGLGDNHKLNVMVGNEVLSNKTNSSEIYGTGYPTEWDMDYAFANMSMSDKNAGRDYVKTAMGTPTHTLSWFGRANYSFLERYLLTFTMRADGSSRFSKDNHWGYFPAAAAAWRISDEPFLAGAQDWLSNLKLRLSIGRSGNDQIDSNLFYTAWKTENATINGQPTTVYKPSGTLGNPDLKWETTTSRNIGIDYGLWGGKLRGSVDLYWNTTSDVLMLVPCDATSGFSYQMQNVAKTENKGVEFTLSYDIIQKKDFRLGVGLTLNHNVNKVKELAEGVNASAHTNWASTALVPQYDYFVEEGQPVGLIHGFKSLGFYTVSDFNYDAATKTYTLKAGVPDNQIANYAGSGNYNLPEGQKAFPGMPKYEDITNDGIVNIDDVQTIGKTQPDITGGFNLNARYKNVDFSANFTYQIGGKIYNANVMADMLGNKDTGLGYNRLAEVADTWKMYDVDSKGDLYAVTDPDELTALNAGAKYGLNYSENGIVTSDFVEDASFLRLQTLTVGYTFPKTWTKLIGISNARVYFTGGNLFCLKKYSGLDPEVNVSPSADSSYSGFPTPNYDYRSYPKARTFTFGLNVSF